MKLKILLLSITTVVTSLPIFAEAPPSITVQGVAEVRVPPDQLSLSCTILNIDKELPVVAAANRELATKITKVLREKGLGEADLTTGTASFGEHTEYKGNKRVKAGYFSTTSISVTTDKLELYDVLWVELSKFPEVKVSASFGLKARSKVRATARKKALQAARKKSEEMADALEVKVGAPLAIVENPQTFSVGYSNASLVNNSMLETTSDDSDLGPLEPGLISVTERVSVTFEILKLAK